MSAPRNPSQKPTDPIRHVVVLMLENRSFDHALGCYQAVYAGLNGIDQTASPRTNSVRGWPSPAEQTVGATPAFPDRKSLLDLPHEFADVRVQIGEDSAMQGFAQTANDFSHGDEDSTKESMKYFDRGELVALHALADTYLICDNWYSSLPGPTWPNRIFALTGTTLGHVDMPGSIIDTGWHWYDQTTIFDCLNQKSVPWRVFFHDVPQSLILAHQFRDLRNAARYDHFREFAVTCQVPEAEFPGFVFIEPAFFGSGANDGHPPHNINKSQELISDVYGAIRGNPDLFASTLLIITFDEHGGFYDHQAPPVNSKFIPDSNSHDTFKFDQLGVRVPTILVSPFVQQGFCSEVFDHTSILRYLVNKWDLQGQALGGRVEHITDLAVALEIAPRDVASLPMTIPRTFPNSGSPPITPTFLHDGQVALLGLSHLLEIETGADAQVIANRSAILQHGPEAQASVAADRVDAFLTKAKTAFPDA